MTPVLIQRRVKLDQSCNHEPRTPAPPFKCHSCNPLLSTPPDIIKAKEVLSLPVTSQGSRLGSEHTQKCSFLSYCEPAQKRVEWLPWKNHRSWGATVTRNAEGCSPHAGWLGEEEQVVDLQCGRAHQSATEGAAGWQCELHSVPSASTQLQRAECHHKAACHVSGDNHY
jgi:hypothetical protein